MSNTNHTAKISFDLRYKFGFKGLQSEEVARYLLERVARAEQQQAQQVLDCIHNGIQNDVPPKRILEAIIMMLRPIADATQTNPEAKEKI